MKCRAAVLYDMSLQRPYSDTKPLKIENIEIDYFDVDSDIEITVSSSNENIDIDFNEDLGVIVVDPADNYYGSGYITVTATEIDEDELSISRTFIFF